VSTAAKWKEALSMERSSTGRYKSFRPDRKQR